MIESIESNKKPLKEARPENGKHQSSLKSKFNILLSKIIGSVAIRIKTANDTIMAGRHFSLEDKLASIVNKILLYLSIWDLLKPL